MKAGDKVICVNDKNFYHIPVRGICEGIIYTVSEVFRCKCGNYYVRLAEVDKNCTMWCPKCDATTYTKAFYHIERFRILGHSGNLKQEIKSNKVFIDVPVP